MMEEAFNREIALPPDDPKRGHCCTEMATAVEDRSMVWLVRDPADSSTLIYTIATPDGNALQACTEMPFDFCPWCGDDIPRIEVDVDVDDASP